MEKNLKTIFISVIAVSVITSSIIGGAMGFMAGTITRNNLNLSGLLQPNSAPIQSTQTAASNTTNRAISAFDEESTTVNTVEKVSPAVVSIIVSKNLPIIERYYSNNPNDFFGFGLPQYKQNGTQKQEIGGGSGFLVSKDGYIITNKHVVADEQADYTVLLNDGTSYVAKVLARDPVNDVAVLKIDKKPGQTADFSFIEFGDSSNLKVGQSVIAIGNALAEFRNTVSTGVISGLSRSITAGSSGFGTASEDLTNVIQTDASINPGNSGGPLLNLNGQLIGVNTAIAAGAQNIGFALPANEVKSIYENVLKNGRIVRPWLGVRYALIDDALAQSNSLKVNYGAWLVSSDPVNEPAIIPGSPAEKAGLKENDIILEINGQKITTANPLSNIVGNLKPGTEITLKISRDNAENTIKVTLGELK